MHNAPSVTYPVGRCAVWAVALAGLALVLATAVVLALPGLSPVQGAVLGMAFLTWLGLALRQLGRQPRGRLGYVGAGPVASGEAVWRWYDQEGGPDRPVQGVRVAIDLQRFLLVELAASAGAPRWVWLDAARAPADWAALRRAVRASTQP